MVLLLLLLLCVSIYTDLSELQLLLVHLLNGPLRRVKEREREREERRGKSLHACINRESWILLLLLLITAIACIQVTSQKRIHKTLTSTLAVGLDSFTGRKPFSLSFSLSKSVLTTELSLITYQHIHKWAQVNQNSFVSLQSHWHCCYFVVSSLSLSPPCKLCMFICIVSYTLCFVFVVIFTTA